MNPIQAGEYVCEYEASEVYPKSELAAKEDEYAINEEGCMVLEVHTKRGWICLDATRSHDTPGRLLNHAPARSATVRVFKPLLINGQWRVAFLANRNISPGEICWDYGIPPEGQAWLMWNKRRGMQPAWW